MDKGVFVKTYKLLAADGTTIISETPGTLGGNSKAGIYGRLDCTAANVAWIARQPMVLFLKAMRSTVSSSLMSRTQ